MGAGEDVGWWGQERMWGSGARLERTGWWGSAGGDRDDEARLEGTGVVGLGWRDRGGGAQLEKQGSSVWHLPQGSPVCAG